MCPARAGSPGLDKVHKLSSNESPLGPVAEGDRGGARARRTVSNSIPTALRPRCASRSAAATASTHPASFAAMAPMSCLALLAHVFLHPGEEGLYSQYGFLTYPICIRAAGGIPVVAEETDRTASVDAHSRKGDRPHQDRLSRQPEQSDRHLHPLFRSEAPARRPAAAHASGDRRGLRRICDPQRLCGRPRACFERRTTSS